MNPSPPEQGCYKEQGCRKHFISLLHFGGSSSHSHSKEAPWGSTAGRGTHREQSCWFSYNLFFQFYIKIIPSINT